jgi:phage shock protein PspC (stress-responsive transcriptional regulator)
MEHRPRALTRSIDRTIGGVAAGVAEYVGVDPTIVRALWVVAAVFAPPFACLGYLLLWVIMPPSTAAPLVRQRASAPGGNALLLGIVLVAVGVILLSGEFGWVRWLGWGLTRVLWPVLLIAAGAFLLTRRRAGN